jgi:hypothetical protein
MPVLATVVTSLSSLRSRRPLESTPVIPTSVLWFVLSGSRGMHLRVDEVECRGARWWSLEEVTATDPMTFDPLFGRFLKKMQRHSAP